MIIAAWVIVGVVVLLGLGYLGLRRLGKRATAPHADEVHMVLTRDVWRVRLCRYRSRREDVKEPEPILFCHGFMSNQFNFTRPKRESMVDYFCEHGYDCWTIDLRGNLSSVAPINHTYDEPTLDDYVQYDIPAAIEYILKATGAPKVHWIGHSMGGMLLYAREGVGGNASIASATTLGSPIGFDGLKFHKPTLIFLLRRILGRYAFRGGMRVLLTFFTTIRPNLKLLPLAWDNMHAGFGADDFYAAADAPPIGVAEGLAEAAQSKTWKVMRDVDVYASLTNMRTPLFAIFGAADPLTYLPTVEPFFSKLSQDKKLLVLSKENGFVTDYSHLDLVFGKEAPTEVFQPILEWVRRHPVNKAAAKPESAKNDAEATPVPKKRAPRKTAAKIETPAPVVEEPVVGLAPAVPATKPATKKKAAPDTERAVEAKAPPAKKAAAKKAVAKAPATKKPVAPNKPVAPKKKAEPKQ